MAEETVVIKTEAPVNPTRGFENGRPITKEDRTPTLIQNDTNSYKFVPRCLAEEMVKAGKAAIITPKHRDEYLKATRLAVGKVEGFKPGELIQIGGVAKKPEEIGLFDSDALIVAAEKAIASAGNDSEVMAAIVKNPESFAAKTERRWQHGLK